MPVPPVNSTTPNSTSSVNLSAAVTPQQTLTQNDFLKLLVAQMSAQDPLNPQSNTDFAAQMAQFSALQTSQSTQGEISLLQAGQQVQQANGLIGRTVTLQLPNGTTPTGVVSGVLISTGVPMIVVNGTPYNLSNVLSIAAAQTTPPTVLQPPPPKSP
jgi:flagellar basal-body rod modification protein FlgD